MGDFPLPSFVTFAVSADRKVREIWPASLAFRATAPVTAALKAAENFWSIFSLTDDEALAIGFRLLHGRICAAATSHASTKPRCSFDSRRLTVNDFKTNGGDADIV